MLHACHLDSPGAAARLLEIGRAARRKGPDLRRKEPRLFIDDACAVEVTVDGRELAAVVLGRAGDAVAGHAIAGGRARAGKEAGVQVELLSREQPAALLVAVQVANAL